MSILCRFVEFYLDYADKPSDLPAWVVRHIHSCRVCEKQSTLSNKLRSSTKQVFGDMPSEPFGGFKPLAVRTSMRVVHPRFMISPGLWASSLVSAVILAVVATNQIQKPLIPVASSHGKNVEQEIASSSVNLFDIDKLMAFNQTLPSEPQPTSAPQAEVKQPVVHSAKAPVQGVPTVAVRPRKVDRQLVASAALLSTPTMSEKQDTTRTRASLMTLRSTQPMVMSMAKSVASALPSTAMGLNMTATLGNSVRSGIRSGAVSEAQRTSSAMMAVPVESLGTPTESGLSL